MKKQIYSSVAPLQVSFDLPSNYSGSISVLDQFYRKSNGFGKSFTKVEEDEFDPSHKDSIVLVAFELENGSVHMLQLGALQHNKNIIGFIDSIDIDQSQGTWAFKPNVVLTTSGKTAKFSAAS